MSHFATASRGALGSAFAPASYTAQPPFDNVRVRRALNYAVDRRRLVELGGGPAVEVPTCQMIPPTVLGYVRNCPYTLDPRSTGEWTAPDVAKAKQLIAASGTRGQKVRVGAWPNVGKEARYLVSVLRRLGYRAQLEELKDWDAYAPTIFDPKTRYVPLFTPRWPLFVSKRVGDWQYYPSEDVLFDQLWVR